MEKKIYISQTLAAFMGCAFAILFATGIVWYSSYSTDTLFYADTHTPMITAADGFYYLAAAQEYIGQNIRPPALSWLAAFVHFVTGITLHNVAFWMPPFITLALFFCYAAWGRVLAFSPLTTFFAALIGSLIPAWLERSRIGWFDTDPGIGLLWNVCLVATAILSLPSNTPASQKISVADYKTHIIAVSVLLTAAPLLAWWWKPGAALAPFCLSVWGLTFFWAKTKTEYYARLITLALCLIAACVILLTPHSISPTIAGLRHYALDHARLVLGIRGDIIATSIEEIATFPLKYSFKTLAGHWISGVFLLGTLACFALRYPRSLLFLLPSIVALCLGFFSERFLYLSALPLGLAAASFGQSVATWLKQEGVRRHAINAISIAIILLPLVHWLWNWTPHGYFLREHDAVAAELRRSSPPNAPVWNWWDDGYFLRARAGLTTFFDGGSQDPLRAFITARPLMTEDLRFARRWIRFFSLRGIHALDPLTQHYQSADKAWDELEKIFAADRTDSSITALPPQIQDWLFPTGPVYLYFSQRILTLSQWWGPLGLSRNPKKEDIRPCVDVFKVSTFYYNPETKHLILPEAVQARGYTGFTDIYETVSKPIKPPFPQGEGLFAINSPFSGWLYLTTRKGLTSLPIRLLAPGGIELEGFRPVAIDYDYAGAWEVLP